MNVKRINSASNPEVKWIRSIKNKKDSHFLVEGLKLIKVALQAGFQLDNLWCSQEDQFSQLLEQTPKRLVPAQLYERLSPTKSNRGPLGVFKRPERELPIFSAEEGRYLLLDHVQDPGNAGALVRAAAAFEMDGVIWQGSHPDLYHHSLIRGSAGTVFTINHFAGLEKNHYNGPEMWGTSANDGLSLPSVKWPSSLILCLGNEGHGLSSYIESRCQKKVSIPMNNQVESLNVSGAAHVLLYEMYNPKIKGV